MQLHALPYFYPFWQNYQIRFGIEIYNFELYIEHLCQHKVKSNIDSLCRERTYNRIGFSYGKRRWKIFIKNTWQATNLVLLYNKF